MNVDGDPTVSNSSSKITNNIGDTSLEATAATNSNNGNSMLGGENNSNNNREMALQAISALSMSDTIRRSRHAAAAADDDRTSSNNKNVNNNKNGEMVLGKHYEPSLTDVICGRGRKAWEHPGNARFRSLLASHVDEYREAKSKLDKSLLVSQLMEQVEEGNPPGQFIKHSKQQGGQWTTVSLDTAREKVGQG